MKKHLLTLLFALGSVVLFAQNSVSGKIVDAETGELLIGATILIKGTTTGVITDLDGSFTLNANPDATLLISYVGYETIEVSASSNLGEIKLTSSEYGLSEIVVLASVAQDRKTPVALSTIKRETILEKASNQEFPELLKSTPGVYATKQGGGYGDSRINLRGFNSENVAVLINGVPVNDMENGNVYWSNWAGLTDVTTTMQVQRGLGASKVAVPSIGGTINIITQSTDAKEGGSVFYGIGNNNYQKTALYASTGLNEEGWALSFSGSRITGNGFVDGTGFEGYNYFFNLSKVINESHSLSLTGFGAPQRHGQRQTRMNISTIKDKGLSYNPDYGYLDGQIVSVEDNFYHKPQVSLNHYWSLNDKTDVSTALYVSTGTGGGGGRAGALNSYRTADGLYDLEEARDDNVANNADNGGDGNAISYLRASRNDHKWYGLLSVLNNDLNSNWNIQGGLDLRYYKGIHFSEVTDLLGADYALDNNDINNPNRRLQVGDKRDYYNDGIVLWEGLFGQAEYSNGDLDAFGSVSVSNTSYQRIDYFQYEGDEQETDFYSFIGYQLKGGANYNLTKNHNVFANAGFFTKAPGFDAVFQNFRNDVNEDAELQKILSFELGYGYRSANFNANVNVYRTNWMDRTLTESVNDSLTANLLGVDALHQGVEIDFNYRPLPKLNITGMASIGDWRWASDLKDVPIFDEDRNQVDVLNLFIADLRVGNSAQTTMALGASYELFDGFKTGINVNYYGNNYADYDPNDRNIEANAGNESWQIPDYYNVDINASYKFKVGNNNAILYTNVNNLLDAAYITDANDGSIQTATVYYGTGRQWTAGLRLNF